VGRKGKGQFLLCESLVTVLIGGTSNSSVPLGLVGRLLRDE